MKKFVNALTITRLFATFVLLFVWKNINPIGIIIFVTIILLTDFFDGLLARKFKVQTLFGAIMDAVADKSFGFIMILILAKYIKMFYILFTLEFIIALINLLAALLGATTKSSFLGRAKMWFLGVSIILGIICITGNELLDIIKIAKIFELITLIVQNSETIIFITISLTAGVEIMIATDYTRHMLKELTPQKKRINLNLKSKNDLLKVLFDTDYYLKHKDQPLSKSLFK